MTELEMLFADTVWRPGIGDPTVAGWITVVLYFSASIALFRCAAWLPAGRLRLYRRAAATLLLFLGLNKQLDLQTLFLQLAKAHACGHGWYDQRRPLQHLFIAAVACCALLFAIALAKQAAGARRPDRWLAAGLIGLVAFVLVRALSLHGLDRLLGIGVPGMMAVNNLLETGALAMCLFGVYLMRKDKPEKRMLRGM